MTLSLSAEHYVSPEIFAEERQQIFARAWWLLGPESQLAETGQYLADTVCGWPGFAIRTESGELKAFHNVCRHRASSIVEQGQGQCDALRCPYHGWLYAHDGRLLKAPRFGDSAEFVQEELSLFSIRVECRRGLVFVAWDETLPGLIEWLGAGDSLCQPYPLPADLEFFGEYTIEGKANWKCYCDNTVEGYHLSLVHPRLAESLRTGEGLAASKP